MSNLAVNANTQAALPVDHMTMKDAIAFPSFKPYSANQVDASNLSTHDKVAMVCHNPSAADALDLTDLSGIQTYQILRLYPHTVAKLPIDKLNEDHRILLTRKHRELSEWLAINE